MIQVHPDSPLGQAIRAAAADKVLVNECLRTGQPLPEHIKLLKFPKGTFDEPAHEVPAPEPVWKVIPRDCRCHAETCCHWAYYITDGQERLGGTDNEATAEKLAAKLNRTPDENPRTIS